MVDATSPKHVLIFLLTRFDMSDSDVTDEEVDIGDDHIDVDDDGDDDNIDDNEFDLFPWIC
jgi:hypothetical protein